MSISLRACSPCALLRNYGPPVSFSESACIILAFAAYAIAFDSDLSKEDDIKAAPISEHSLIKASKKAALYSLAKFQELCAKEADHREFFGPLD